MSKELGRYDPMDGGMFVEPVHEMDIKVAESIRWGVDNGRYAEDMYAEVIIFQRPKTPQENIAATGDY